jgi:signal transduction histidine kinase
MNAPDTGAGVGHAADGGVGRHPAGQARLRRLADEQAALRRVATLVAGGARPAEVFTSVADELGRLIGAEAAYVTRVDHLSGEREGLEEHLTVVGSYGRVSDQVPVGFRHKLQPGMVHTAALQMGRPARINGEQLATGPFGAMVGKLGVQAAVATPIVVGGRNWGVMMAVTSREDFPAGTESRMADFMELAATAIANAQAEQELRELADIQGALRRLAILVARGEPPEAVFAAATREARRHFGGGTARMIRYEPDGTETLLANEGTPSHVRVGERWEGYPPTGLTVTVRRTGRAGRVDDYRDVPGAEVRLREGILSSVAVPIYVNGQLWGMIAVGSGQAPLPPDTEQRMSEFTDLVATAVANAQNRAALEASRDALARLLEEQAALRRVATLVAREIEPAEIFSAVAEEIRRLLGADNVGIGRFEQDGAYCVIVSSVGENQVTPVGRRVRVHGYHAPAVVWRTGRAAQTDEDAWSGESDPVTDALREVGFRSMVASPINVEGRLWGVVNALTRKGPFPAGSADRMADFTELAATAIGNAESRAELTASRHRIVAAADETRRRIERDLHDGTQQQLVSLGFELRVAQSVVPAGGLAELQTEIGRVAGELDGVVEDLREIARGIHPAILSEGGLGPALRTLARRAAIAVQLNVAAMARLPEPVEVAAYYVVSEALTNTTKHARASVVEVDAEVNGGTLRVRVRDDGAGGADPVRGSGLVGLKDRIEALGGTFSVHSPVGGGTTVSCGLPVRAGAGEPDAGPGQ